VKDKWPLTPLSEVLTERRETPSEEDIVSWRVRIIEKISFDTGRIQFRSNGSTRTGMILVRPGDLVVSGINAAKGAIAIYDPDATEPVAATIHYAAYIPNPARVDVRFLWWMLRSRFFQELLNEYLPGGIKTELKAKRLLPVPVPMPPLTEQRRIVARISDLASGIASGQSLRQAIVQELETLPGVFLQRLVGPTTPIGSLGDILVRPPRNGWSAQCDNAPEGIPVLSLSAVTGYRYRATEFKRTSLYADPDAHYWLKPGDILITRSNSLELVGHAAIYDGNPAPCIYPDLMMRIEPDSSLVDSRFLWYWLQCPMVRDFIRTHAKGTSPSMKKISQGTVTGIPYPTRLSLQEQRHIAAKMDRLLAESEQARVLHTETSVQLDALLPAILDQAFKGQL
jgi:type I restriction enzyme S subunit